MFLLHGAANANGMSIASDSFTDGSLASPMFAGDGGDCGGLGMAPQVSWANLPAGTKSIAVVMFDIDGANGLGVSHWVAYNIDARRGQLKQGEGKRSGDAATVGKNQAGDDMYLGMCPPVGDVAHHYILTVIATDIEPGLLPKGLGRINLWNALDGHALRAQSLVARYAR